MRIIRLACALMTIGVTFLSAGAAARQAALPADVLAYLTKAAGFTQADLTALEGGRVIAKVEPGSSDTEMMVVGAVKIRSTRAQVTSYYGQMVSWVDGTVTLGFGRFSTPPALSDVATLVLDKDEIDALRTCRPNNCDVRIGAAGIDAMQRNVNWKAADAAEQAQRFVRKAMVDYVTSYQASGDAALITYNDAAKPVSLADQWRGLVAGSKYFHEYAPAIREYLIGYPKARHPGGRDIFYWVKEDFGLKPTISLVHGVIHEPAGQDRTVVAQKQIFASHYYLGSLNLATIVGGTESGRPISYLVYANRSRGDMLKGGFGGLKRSIARDQARKATEDTLGTIQTMLEKAAGLSPRN